MFSNALRRHPHLQSLRTDLSALYLRLVNLRWPAKCCLCGLFMFLITIIAVAMPRLNSTGTGTHCSRCPPSSGQLVLDSNEDLNQRISADPTSTSNNHEASDRVIFAHCHISKTAGTTINALLAHSYERVCGNKGYSYDAHQANQRHKAAGGGHVKTTRDSFSTFPGGHNRQANG